MKQLEIKSKVTIYEQEDELSIEDKQLLSMARNAATKAYAVYSHFQVGAALLLNNGKIVTGSNQENAVYPAGLCAERTTAFAASATYPDVPFKKLVIAAINPQNKLTIPVPPCGMCRQVLAEYEKKSGQPIEILMAGEEGEIWKVEGVSALLPITFSSDFLPEE